MASVTSEPHTQPQVHLFQTVAYKQTRCRGDEGLEKGFGKKSRGEPESPTTMRRRQSQDTEKVLK